ncbi:hypothetical protein AAF712_007447 [Marasmius tenuissimus]|uniref:DUF6699 domain-containing protein n=1 Tax=Marasmius tenuissimus TaxID=585030 RepID=A0ABR2ZWS1_9AGAR
MKVDLRYPHRHIRPPVSATELDAPAVQGPVLVQSMRLFHPHLPWYVDVFSYNGITVKDVISALIREMRRPVSREVLSDPVLMFSGEDKTDILTAKERRIGAVGDEDIHTPLRRVDFLREHTSFHGLEMMENGLWRMCTSKPTRA